MLIKLIGSAAVVLFMVCLVAVLQGWSKSTLGGHVLGLSFLFAFCFAAAWGIRTLVR